MIRGKVKADSLGWSAELWKVVESLGLRKFLKHQIVHTNEGGLKPPS